MCGAIVDGGFFLNNKKKRQKKLENTEISVTGSLTGKRMEMLNNAKKFFVSRNVWTLVGKNHDLAEGCIKP